MARGKEQPDSITFYDTDEHEHNRILINNRYTVTPWVSEDKLTINLFGIQENCVEICPFKYPNLGRGLVDGKFRIQYYNTSGLVEVHGQDIGCDEDDCPWNTEVSPTLFEIPVCVGRTPHYMAICKKDHWVGCTRGCEYFPAYTASDHSLRHQLDDDGIYDVPCPKGYGNYFTFNGTANDTEEAIETFGLRFEDKCETDSFLFTSGQTIILEGNLTGHMEVLIDNTVNTTDHVLFRIYGLGDEDPNPTEVMRSTIVSELANEGEWDQFRFWVYAKHGTADFCLEGCVENGNERKCYSLEPNGAPSPTTG